MLRSLIFTSECSSMAPRTPIVMVIKGFTFHPLCFSVSISGSYNLCLFSIVVST